MGYSSAVVVCPAHLGILVLPTWAVTILPKHTAHLGSVLYCEVRYTDREGKSDKPPLRAIPWPTGPERQSRYGSQDVQEQVM